MAMGRTVDITTASEAQTAALADRIARQLQAGDVVALCGDLGTGKTRFVAGACRALGYAGRVRSPSYTLLNIYRGACAIYHFDLYRWDAHTREDEIEEWLELMEGDGVSFIEWAERMPPEYLGGALVIRLRHAGETRRRLTIEDSSERYGVIMDQLRGTGECDAG